MKYAEKYKTNFSWFHAYAQLNFFPKPPVKKIDNFELMNTVFVEQSICWYFYI